jgi:hypothetical protein
VLIPSLARGPFNGQEYMRCFPALSTASLVQGPPRFWRRQILKGKSKTLNDDIPSACRSDPRPIQIRPGPYLFGFKTIK